MKKVLVVFDTTYGNTEKLGREVAAGIEESGLAECKVININDVETEDISVYDGVLFGGPIHAFRATRGIKGAVKKAAKKGLDGKLVSSFDTYQASGHAGKAAQQIEDELKKRAKGAKKGKASQAEPMFSSIPAPREIKEFLDEYVIGQDHAKKV